MNGKFLANTLEFQIKRTIEYWSWRLNDHRRESDFEMACWAKVLVPQTGEKLERIYRDQDVQRGGVRGVSRFLSRICTNVWRDYLRSRSADSRIPSHLQVSLSDHTPSQNCDDPGEETLADAITGDEGGGYQAFSVEDLRESLNPEQISLVKSIVAGQSLREFAVLHGYSKSSAGRIRERVVAKVERQTDGIRQKSRTIITAIPLSGRSSYRPDRISCENLESWAAGPSVVPFTVCAHAIGNGDLYQDFSLPGATTQPGRFALCHSCWTYYWRSLSERMAADIAELELLESEAVET